MKKVRDNSAVPPGGSFNYRDPETGFELRSHAFHVLRSKAKSYRQLNNLPIGLGWDDQFEEIVCEHTPRACMDFEPPTLAQKAQSLSRAFVQWAKAGFKVRSEEEAQRILTICRSCDQYGGESGLLKVVCKLCGCSRKKIYMAGQTCPKNPPLWS